MTSIHSLHLAVTGACNLRCDYCYQRHTARRMEWETLRAALDWACTVRRQRLRLTFSGGEPLLEFPMIRRAVAYAHQQADPAFPLQHILLTNGLLLDDDAIGFLVEHEFELQLSFDGVREAQDLRAPGTFEALDQLLNRLLREQPDFYRGRLSVAMTVVPSALPHLADSVAYFLEKRVPEVAIAGGLVSGTDWLPDQIGDLERQFERILEISLDHHRRTGQIPLLLLRGGSSRAEEHPWRRNLCGVVHAKTPAVDVDGHVYGCALLVEPMLTSDSSWFREELRRLRIGHLADPAFAERFEAWAQNAYRSRLLGCREVKRSSYGRCEDCRYAHECSICPASIGLMKEGADRKQAVDPNRIPDYPCAFTQVSLRARERFTKAISADGDASPDPRSDSGIDPLARFLGVSELPPAMKKVKAFWNG
jgi:sulfatase maturation enzyme AslB (radical SAM superfamily)